MKAIALIASKIAIALPPTRAINLSCDRSLTAYTIPCPASCWLSITVTPQTSKR